MTIAFRSSLQSNSTSGATTTLTAPAGVTAGDVLVALVTANATGGPVISAAPAGWSLCDSVLIGTATRVETYRKVAGASEPSTYTWTFDRTLTTFYSSGCMAAYSGGGGLGGGHGGQANAASTSVTAPSIFPGADNGALVYMCVTTRNFVITPPSGMTERLDASIGTSGGGRVEIADVALSSSSATGTATTSDSSANAAFLIAIIPQSLGAPLFFGSL